MTNMLSMGARSLLTAAIVAAGLSGPLAADVPELGNGDCFRELASIDYGHSSEGLENNRFRYVFQHVDTYPYYRVVEGVFIGIWTPGTRPGAMVPNRNYWSFVQGREGVGAEENFSLFHDIRGVADVSGVPVEIDAAGDFAFFLYPRTATDEKAYLADAARRGDFSVLTTTDAGAEFIATRQSRNWRLGEDTGLRLYSSRFSQCDVWCDGEYDGKYLRTVFMVENAVTVGGRTHRRDRICRLEYYPLVVTNSTALLGSVHDELAARADRIHVARIVNGVVPASSDEWSAAFERVDPAVLVKVATIPKDHRGDFSTDTRFGTVSIQFTRDFAEDNDDLISSAFYRGNYRYWRHRIVGRMRVDDRDLGPVTVVNLGEINQGWNLRSKVLDQNFRTIGSTRRNQNGGLQCGEESCDVVVSRQQLTLH